MWFDDDPNCRIAEWTVLKMRKAFRRAVARSGADVGEIEETRDKNERSRRRESSIAIKSSLRF